MTTSRSGQAVKFPGLKSTLIRVACLGRIGNVYRSQRKGQRIEMAWSRKVERELNTRKRERILRKEHRKLLQEREGEEETDRRERILASLKDKKVEKHSFDRCP